MSEKELTPSTSNEQQTSSSTPLGGTPSSEAASTAKADDKPRNEQGQFVSQEWKAGDSSPAWARGKSAEEILGIATNLVDTFSKYGQATPPQGVAQHTQQQPFQQQQSSSFANQQTNTASANINVADDDYITGAQLKQMLNDVAKQQVSPQIQQSLDMASSANLGIVRQQYAKDFQKYGPEITQKLAQVPRHLWTVDNLETVVKLVKVDHLDDLGRERAQEIVNTMEPTIRSTGAGGSVPVPTTKEHSLESERIPAEWKKRALAAGITEDTVREFCMANEMTPADFYAQFEHLGDYARQTNPIVQEIKSGDKATVG